jgi:predicted RNase H-like HicB family nuclease
MAKRSLKKKVYQFIAILEKNEDGGYTVTVPSLPGCISEGDTFDKALKNIKEAIILYLEVMKKDKEKIKDEEEIIFAPVKVKI